VRAWDVAAGRLRPEVIVAKNDPEETWMAGYPDARVASPDGAVVYTLYRSRRGPFIHALDVANGFALCVDLPRRGSGDDHAGRLWGLVVGAGGSTVYAANPALGLVVESDGSEVRRTAEFAPAPAGGTPAATASVALARDGSLLLVAGGRGVTAIGTGDLQVRARWLEGWTVDALAATPDGGQVFALSRGHGSICQLDPASGALVAERPAPAGALLHALAG
jgi:hypothetical protein